MVLIPLVMTVFGGLKTTGDLLSNPIGWPDRLHWENFDGILQNPSFWLQMRNSLFVMLATALGSVFLSSMPAFIFARTPFPGRELVFNFFTLGLLFPLAVAILPLYISLRQLNLIDSHWGIFLPQIAFGLPGTILILRGFFASLPQEIEDAAYIDGCSTFGFFWYVALPLGAARLGGCLCVGDGRQLECVFPALACPQQRSIVDIAFGHYAIPGPMGDRLGTCTCLCQPDVDPHHPFLLFRRTPHRHWPHGRRR